MKDPDDCKTRELDFGSPKKVTFYELQPGMFPVEFNKLRELLYEEHHDLWLVCGGMMMHNQPMLIDYLNQELGTTAVPSHKISTACEIWIKALDKRTKVWRG